ncbi:MAG: NYN domain-containing protein [Nanoarchaeota archaeon]
MKNAIVFVDANNWYHNVKKFFEPGQVDILKLAEFLCKVKGYDLIEVRWYASIPSIMDGEAMYYKHMSFLQYLEKKGIKVVTRKLQRLSNKEVLQKKKETIDSLDLCENCRPLVESTFLDLGDLKKKEKGIDIWVAIDMIKFSIIDKVCDVCILVSGDADYVPALDLIRSHKKEILTAMVPFGYSSELIRNFPFFILRKETLMKCLRDYKDVKGDK